MENPDIQAGVKIRRLKDGRIFKITVVNRKPTRNIGTQRFVYPSVFSAVSADEKWGDWGGGMWQLVLGETYELVVDI